MHSLSEWAPLQLRLLLLFALPGPLRSGGGGGSNPAGAPHMDVRRFPKGQDAPPENSRRPRGLGASRRARRRAVLSLGHVALHKQRNVARAVTARNAL